MLNIKKLLSKILNAPIIIEQGSSGIWFYRKWSDGTAEIRGYYSKTVAAKSQDLNNYIDLPFTFDVAPTITLGLRAGGADYYRAHIESWSTTRIRLVLINNYTSSVSMGVNIIGIGRWK